MIKMIERLIKLIKTERNWKLRTSDAPRAFRKIKSYVAAKETWDAKKSEHLEIRIIKDADSEDFVKAEFAKR